MQRFAILAAILIVKLEKTFEECVATCELTFTTNMAFAIGSILLK